MADEFARQRFRWLDRIAADLKVSAAAFKVAYVISGYVNKKTGDAWPNQQTISDKIGMSDRAVRDLVGELRAAGHMTVVSGHGPGRSNRYRPAFAEQATLFHAIDRQQPAAPSAPAAAPRRTRRIPASPEGFDEFYRAYPRKVAKDAALRAYARIINGNRATATELLKGAMRYAAQRDGEDPQFTKYPATWLNGGCWADEPLARADRPAASPPVTGLASAAGGIKAVLLPDEDRR